LEWRTAKQRLWPTSLNDTRRLTPSARIGKQQRQGIPRTGLDADLTSPPGEAKDQNDVGLVCKQLRQITIDSRIGRRKDMDAAIEASEGRPPPASERQRDRRTRVERSAGEGAEASKEDAHRLKLYNPGDCLDGCGRRCDACHDVSLDPRQGRLDGAVGS
jgi:hypothetical protein